MQIERLLTLGEAQGIDYAKLAEPGYGSGNDGGGLTGRDVHLAMSWLPREQRAILYLKPNPARLKASDLASLTNHLWLALIGFEAQKLSHYEGDLTPAIKALLLDGNKARDRRQARTVKVALAEYEDSKLCETCKGSVYPGKVGANVSGQGVIYTTCPNCDGRTWNPWSDNKRAGLVGGTRSQWRERHEPGYLHLLNECSELYREGAKAFKERLFGPAKIEATLQRRA